MIQIEKTEIYGWEAAIRGMYNGKGVRWVYPNKYEAFISSHGKFLSCGTYTSEEQAREAVIITKIKLFEASVIAHGDNPTEIIESVEKGYFASPNGNIYNRHGDLMVGGIDHCGYRHGILNRKNRNFHRVIAETFIPNPYNLPCINHKDGNKLNNKIENLEWCSCADNVKHAYDKGLTQKVYGEDHHAHKITENQVRYIKRMYIKGDRVCGAAALSRKFKVDRSTICAILKGETWRGVK